MQTEYELRELFVEPDALFLDPNNPRLRSTIKHGHIQHVSDENIISQITQDAVLSEIIEDGHDIEGLLDSIRNSGYLNIDSIFVREIFPGQYLVMEGNRRTAAIKSIESEIDKLNAQVWQTLQKIPVKVLLCEDDDKARELISRILAIRHISGPKEWGPMLEAFHIYEEYNTEHGAESPTFVYNSITGQIVASNINKREDSVSKAIAIVRVFKQLQELEAEVSTSSYSLLKMCLDDSELREQYFEIDYSTLDASHIGLERMYNLMFSEDPPISNPTNFRRFKDVFKFQNSQGEVQENFVKKIEARLLSPIQAKSRVGSIEDARGFEVDIKYVVEYLSNIPVEKFRGVQRELDLIDELIELVRRIAKVADRPKRTDLENLQKMLK